MAIKTLSVIIPAFNEEKNLEDSVKSVLGIAPKYTSSLEILIVNDGSKDKTAQIAENLSKKDKRIKVLHNKKNMGMGYSYWKGVENAKYKYTILVWGDYAHTDQSLKKILSYIGKCDVVIPNYTNMNTRTWKRRTLSKLFTNIINLITGLSIKYYNGSTLYSSHFFKKFPRKSAGFGYQAEVLAYVLKLGAKYIQVDVKRRNLPDGTTAAFRLKNILSVLSSLAWIFYQYRIAGKKDKFSERRLYGYVKDPKFSRFDDKYEQRVFYFKYIYKYAFHFREGIYKIYEKNFPPDPKEKILDLGVSDNGTDFFHELFPFTGNITAAGLPKTNSLLKRNYPEIKYICVPKTFPYFFKDNQFDIVHTSAVIEHVGDSERQITFMKEAIRIGKKGMISTPNRWYPVELHTYLPFLHWLPAKIYRFLYKILRLGVYADENNLNILEKKDLVNMARQLNFKKYWVEEKKTLGLVSNYLFFWKK